MRFLVPVVLLAACGRTADARPESNARLVGTATFVGGAPATDRGRVRLSLRVLGEINDACDRSGLGVAAAAYDGELVIAADGTVTADLYPVGMETIDGCAISDIRVQQVTSIGLTAQLGDRVGWGVLTFQTLSAVDERDLERGLFGELHADFMFEPPPPPPAI